MTKYIPAYEIWGGIPARKIGNRLDNTANQERSLI